MTVRKLYITDFRIKQQR